MFETQLVPLNVVSDGQVIHLPFCKNVPYLQIVYTLSDWILAASYFNLLFALLFLK